MQYYDQIRAKADGHDIFFSTKNYSTSRSKTRYNARLSLGRIYDASQWSST